MQALRSALRSSQLRGLHQNYVKLPPLGGIRGFKKKKKGTSALPGKPLNVKWVHNPTVPKALKKAFLTLTEMDPSERLPVLMDALSKPAAEDGIDLGLENYSPYQTTDLVKDRLWRVRYECVDKMTLPDTEEEELEDFLNCLGIDFRRAAKNFDDVPENMRDLAKQDAELVVRLSHEDRATQLREGACGSFDMLIVKLESGGLLLYNPVRLHPEMVEFIAERGEVKFIVLPDQMFPDYGMKAIEQYPDAALICSDKMQINFQRESNVNAEYLYTVEDDVARARDKLAPDGVQLFPMIGDVHNVPLLVQAHGHLLHNGLLYGHLDGTHHAALTLEQNLTPGWPGTRYRIEYYETIKVSPNRILAPYRLAFMDPTMYYKLCCYTQPAEDLSHLTALAGSLREVLKSDFEAADDVNSRLPGSMPADEFRATIDAGWKWLDGESLL